LPADLAGAAVRFSLGRETTDQEIDRSGAIVGQIIARIRSATAGARAETYAAV